MTPLAKHAFTVGLVSLVVGLSSSRADEMRQVSLQSRVDQVQPMTGIVLWTTNEAVESASIQLEYSYLTYAAIVSEDGAYNWEPVERLLSEVSQRGHQAVLRWHDTYVGQPTGIPKSITSMDNYTTTRGKSEGKLTEFPDWSHQELRRFVLEFFTRFAERYDRDPRLAFVQVGFGLWAEYHIYDGPMQLGKTFPSKEYQAEFAKHLSTTFHQTPWMISVDAADEDSTPFAENSELLALQFGVFDDSFNHKKHAKENAPNWAVFGADRWKQSPAGGEFSFFTKVDQSKALAPRGPHGVPFEKQAADFHVSFIIGDAQPEFQPDERIRSAGLSCGYRFEITAFETSRSSSNVTIRNTGVAPIYYDAWPAVNGVRAQSSLKGLLPGETRTFRIKSGSEPETTPELKLECDRLVPGQRIQFDADL
jgi:hypothetical protein